MKVKVLLFAALRELAGESTLELELDDGATLADAVTELASRHAALKDHRFATALNQRYSPTSAPLADGDEVALIPPVSGG